MLDTLYPLRNFMPKDNRDDFERLYSIYYDNKGGLDKQDVGRLFGLYERFVVTQQPARKEHY